MEVSGQPQASAAFPLGKSLRNPLNRRLGGPRRKFGLLGTDKDLAHAGIRTPDCPTRSLGTSNSRIGFDELNVRWIWKAY
jgi:hypothetical protein